jgi:hypothetical protein
MATLIEVTRELWLKRGRADFEEGIAPGIHAVLDKLPEVTARFSSELRDHLATIKVICFSERHDSSLMWSHYADSHAGLVFEFRNVVELDSPYKLAKPIQYSSHPPKLATTDELARFISGDERIDGHITDRMIYTKSDDWSYEREWRISSGDGRIPADPVEYAGFGTQELYAIYFGCKATALTKQSLLAVLHARYPGTLSFQAVRATHTYALSFDRIAD